jgi:protein-S-isoprenylcysteine O-methyltransferase Ste14
VDISAWTPFLIVEICWIVFAATFAFRRRGSSREEKRRDNRSIGPIIVQSVAFFVVWVIHRPFGTPLIGWSSRPYLGALAVIIAIGSIWLVIVSVRTLGKQWAFAASVIEGHQLITEGPYAHVRNPIYSGMLGMLVATGIVASTWYGMVAAVVVFLAGTAWRVRVEERLLRSEFGREFEDYTRRVPSLIPHIW